MSHPIEKLKYGSTNIFHVLGNRYYCIHQENII